MREKEPRMMDMIEEVEEGKAECYWCSRVFDKSKMRQVTFRGLKQYVCEGC
jgi:hypothetical protein